DGYSRYGCGHVKQRAFVEWWHEFAAKFLERKNREGEKERGTGERKQAIAQHEIRERLIRPDQESIHWIFDLGCDFAPDQEHHQHRNQCHAKKCGEEHRKSFCECERLKETAFLRGEREHRNETDRDDQQREEEGAPHAFG